MFIFWFPRIICNKKCYSKSVACTDLEAISEVKQLCVEQSNVTLNVFYLNVTVLWNARKYSAPVVGIVQQRLLIHITFVRLEKYVRSQPLYETSKVLQKIFEKGQRCSSALMIRLPCVRDDTDNYSMAWVIKFIAMYPTEAVRKII